MPKDNIDIVEETAIDSELASLKQQRSLVKKNISNIQKKVEKDGSKMDSTILECRLEILDSYFKQLCTIQSQIEAINANDNGRSDLEETFIVAKAKILKLINKRRGSVSVDNSLMNVSMACGSSSRLPSLKLPNFGGKYSEYQRFITAFNNIVNDNPAISIIEKFNYLINCLSGPALAVVEPYQICEENYEKALQRLQERYDNKVLIFLEHIESLFNVPKMQSSDSVSLRHLIDTVSAVRGSLLSLESEADVMNAILVHMVLSKVDIETKDNYDEKQDFKSLPSWNLCYELLSHRCQFLESNRKRTDVTEKVVVNNPKPNSRFNRSVHTFVNSNSNCSYCNSSEHNLATCSSFSNIVVSERFNFVKRSGLCINCLRKGHMVSNCPSKSRCRVCDSAHHTLLHIFSCPEQPSSSNSNGNSPQPSTSSNPISLVARSFKRAIIPTALILMKDSCGSFQAVRALLDSCSELNFISEETAKRLKLKFRSFSQEISGIGEVRTAIKFSVDTTIKSRSNSFMWSSTFAVTKNISSRQPGELINTSQWIPQNIELADPLYYKPKPIDVLLSAEVFFDLLLDGKISFGNGLPCLTNTVFGWIVGGSSPSRPNSSSSLTCNLIVSTQEQNVDDSLNKIWNVEEYSKPTTYNEEQACEDHFVEYSRFDSYGRVKVRLPFKKLPNCLGNSFEVARKRFLSLESRLERESTLKSMHEEFMQEYVSLGYMSPYNQLLNNLPFLIPHHCVLKPQSCSTKLRVVFDAFSHTSSNHSLNDKLMVGPIVQQDLITTLFSFRWIKYTLTADISKMYRQFRIGEPDRTSQLVLWRSNKKDNIKVFQLNIVNNGLSAAPFFASRISFLITDKHSIFYPSRSEVLPQNLYVDDALTWADNIETLALKRDELIQILKWHGFELAKWENNHASLNSNYEEIALKASDNYITKTLCKTSSTTGAPNA
ncbi:uncharacterized protein [Musca autumnalis]|uniref:uncharacterized protein n=1 Tax=Musca autumnalis TaxID=221902 RepID=UPI003CEFCD44